MSADDDVARVKAVTAALENEKEDKFGEKKTVSLSSDQIHEAVKDYCRKHELFPNSTILWSASIQVNPLAATITYQKKLDDE